MTRVFLEVSGCDDHTSIALDNLTDAERALLEAVTDALYEAGGGCSPTARLTDTDVDADEREPETYGAETFPARRPLVTVAGGAS